MKQELLKRITAVLSVFAMVLVLVGTTPLTVKADTVTDETVEVTTGEITIKVGQAWGISMENIDKLLTQAGSEYQSNPSSTPRIFYGDRVEMSNEYLVPAFAVGIFDESTNEVYETIYVADTEEEWGALVEELENGTLDTKYGAEVGIVEEAEGFSFYARAEKEGTATITIPKYPVVGGETITVHIPVVIEATEVKKEVEATIKSATDESIVIDNTNGVLPAGTVLESAKVESGESFEKIKKLVEENVEAKKYTVYELNLFDANKAEINQLSGKIKVTLDVPFEVSKGYTVKVYRVDGDKLTECASTVKDGKITFETDHFSTYVFTEEATVPDTGDSSNVHILAVIFMAGCVILASRLRKRA